MTYPPRASAAREVKCNGASSTPAHPRSRVQPHRRAALQCVRDASVASYKKIGEGWQATQATQPLLILATCVTRTGLSARQGPAPWHPLEIGCAAPAR